MREFFYLLKWKPRVEIKDIIANLRSTNCFPKKLRCPACTGDMVMHKDNSRKDSFRWVCKNCRKRKPIRINTWASKYRISLTQLYLLIRQYVENYDTNTIAKRLSLDNEVVTYIFHELNILKPLFVEKMAQTIEREILDENIKQEILNKKQSFSELSSVFALYRVFEIVLRTLNENYTSNKEDNYQEL